MTEPRHRETTTGDFALSADYAYRFNDTSSYNHAYTQKGTHDKKQIDDTTTPGFRSLLKCGKFLPLNPVKIQLHRHLYTPGTVDATSRLRSDNSVQFQANGELFEIYGGVVSPALGFPGRLMAPELDQSTIDAAVIAAMANVANADWDTLTFLAELRETNHYMASVAHRFNGLTEKLALLAAKSKKNPWHEFKQLWLEWRFSIRPMIGDMKNAAEALSNALEDEFKLLRGRGRQIVTGSDARAHEQYINANTVGFSVETLSYNVTCRANAYMQLENVWGHKFGFDQAVTAWELIPYSFVVDYFTNIGSWVSTLNPQLSHDFMGQSVSIRTEEIYEVRSHIDWHDSVAQTVSGHHNLNCVGRLWVDTYQRSAYAGVPLPSFKPRLTIPKLIDIAALFIGGRSRVQRILNRDDVRPWSKFDVKGRFKGGSR